MKRCNCWVSTVKKKCAMQSKIVRCPNFGTNRHQKYPNAFFCNTCDVWDQWDVLNARLNCEMAKYKCQAVGHVLDNNPQKKQARAMGVPCSRWQPQLPPVSPPRPIRRRTAENQTTNQNYDETATDQNYDEMASLPTPRTTIYSNQQVKKASKDKSKSSTAPEKIHTMVKLHKLKMMYWM